MIIYRADALYIGYPKAASTFIRTYLRNHPNVTVDHNCAADILLSPREPLELQGKPDKYKIHVTVDESIAESVITDGTDLWRQYCKVPGAWPKIKDHVTIDADLTAAAFQQIYPWVTKVIIVIREQSDWLRSAYQYSMSSLPPSQRSFADFLETPQAIALLYAGHHHRVISAWQRRFRNVRVFRYEDLSSHIADFMGQLTDFLEVPLIAPKELALNESNSSIARIQRALPLLDRLPKSYKRWLRSRVKPLLPNTSILTKAEEKFIKGSFAFSNKITEDLLCRQWSGYPSGRLDLPSPSHSV